MSTSKDPVSRIITLSVWASVAWGVGALALGAAITSQTIIVDGLYSLVTMTLSIVALGAARAVRRGPDERHPFGREAFEPMANMVKAVGLGGLSLYAIVNGILTINEGGNSVDYRWGLGYSVVVTIGGTALTVYLYRKRRSLGSELVGGEATKWMADTLDTAGVGVAFGIGLYLQETGRTEAAEYVDPIVVILFSAVSFIFPLRMGIQSFRELALESPSADILDEVRTKVTELQHQRDFADSVVRVGKVGSQLSVEVYFILGDDSPDRDVPTYDEYRRELDQSLDELGYDLWLTVCFTADRSLAGTPQQ